MAKKELFTSELQYSASFFKALAHPARLAIMQYLAETKSCMTGDISEELPLSRTTVNQHLKELKDVGLIQGQIEGAKVNYCLDPEKLCELKKVFLDFFSSVDVKGEFDCK
jgi:ArsR family transcriptional regulator, arsenate/arsenite/antimonite-responsive transcriptional repressor